MLIPCAKDLGLASSGTRGAIQAGGEDAAWRILHSFIQERGRAYHREMSSPITAQASCSRLSPYLAWGCISMRSVVQTARRAIDQSWLPATAGRSFLSRCH